MAIPRIVLASLAGASYVLAQPGCRTQTAYNPIYEDYTMSPTGVMNGTFSLAFIPRDVADSLLPEGYTFLDDNYREAVEQWSEDVFPVLIKAVHVHDMRAPDDLWRNDHTIGINAH